MMILSGTADALYRRLIARYPQMPALPPVRLQMANYQLVALFGLALDQCGKGGRILEIGTGRGGSAYILSKAAPAAEITTLTPNETEAFQASTLLRTCPNVDIVVAASWDYLATYIGQPFDMIYIDGDHNRIARDMPWWNRLNVGGLLLCHDYSSAASTAPSTIVFDTLNAFAARLGRPFDVELIDENLLGMVGFHRQAGELWTEIRGEQQA